MFNFMNSHEPMRDSIRNLSDFPAAPQQIQFDTDSLSAEVLARIHFKP